MSKDKKALRPIKSKRPKTKQPTPFTSLFLKPRLERPGFVFFGGRIVWPGLGQVETGMNKRDRIEIAA